MRYVSVRIAAELQDRLRSKLFSALLMSKMDFINEKRQGVLLSVLNEHTVRAGQAFFLMIQVLGQWVTVATYASFVTLISWKLTLISLFLGSGVGPVIRWIGKQIYKEGSAYTKAIEDAQHRAMEGLHAKKLANAMNWASTLEHRFQTDSARPPNQNMVSNCCYQERNTMMGE